MSFTDPSSDPRIFRALQSATARLRTDRLSADENSAISVPSARHAVFLLPGVRPSSCTSAPAAPGGGAITAAASRGGGIIVIRVWRDAPRWWDVGGNPAPAASVAWAEVAGYRLARRALKGAAAGVVVPDVLHFDPGGTDDAEGAVGGDRYGDGDGSSLPWALMEYVGAGSAAFEERTHDGGKFVQDMVKMRREFGADEPHPRHGRVDAEQAERYAMMVLKAVVLPMHAYFRFVLSPDEGAEDLAALGPPKTYVGMAEFAACAAGGSAARLRAAVASSGSEECRTRLLRLAAVLDASASRLRAEPPPTDVPGPALCHCDLQPQNLIFHTGGGPADAAEVPRVACVLDWEEAGWADPRFELLLICRKVCANRSQADSIWGAYADALRETTGADAGPLDPWLALEGVHSIATEAGKVADRPDDSNVLGKVERELERLGRLGWVFDTVEGEER
mmetsp:Transcript_14962/g.29897  ORF Transcript_14962/g.29897 Transcript_14962/m.29897 type:complete len:450 (+) Transcript_14962:235-1584(+)|eukprot:CAMPEP_0194332530 /NCGR_PEP_ID=MMETSP0171-20130528/59433_1 /TAXON_ID=218684 /ORGANISM="Corethron pennatum, Strain L29A3" /LENGTH=449 /DNA_ID=CAMNT_0039094427 /DNA_START=198 /DNA_END=1547 /DNA_ORIENTATION=-